MYDNAQGIQFVNAVEVTLCTASGEESDTEYHLRIVNFC